MSSTVIDAEMVTDLHMKIAKFGHTHLVDCGHHDNRPKHMYTVGLAAKGLPELVVSGNLTNKCCMMMLCDVAHYLSEHPDDYKLGIRDDLFTVRWELRDVTSENVLREYVPYAVELYGDKVRVLQVIWADQNSVLPNEPGFDVEKCTQEVFAKLN
jgi:hypothetical protein